MLLFIIITQRKALSVKRLVVFLSATNFQLTPSLKFYITVREKLSRILKQKFLFCVKSNKKSVQI